MKSLPRNLALTAAVVLAMATTHQTLAGPDRETPRYGGTLNVATVFSGLNALSFKHYNWPWKTNHDALYMDQLIAGDLDLARAARASTNTSLSTGFHRSITAANSPKAGRSRKTRCVWCSIFAKGCTGPRSPA